MIVHGHRDYGILSMRGWVHERAAEAGILRELDIATTLVAHLLQHSDEAKAIFERDYCWVPVDEVDAARKKKP